MTVLSHANEKWKYVRLLAKDGALRRREGVFVAEGPRLLAEALAARAPIVSVFAAPDMALPTLPDGVPVYTVPADRLTQITPAQTSQGVLFLCGISPRAMAAGGRYVLLDGLADPGNVGTILRTADAFAFDGALLTEGTADPFLPKTVRATMGAIFRLPVAFLRAGELDAALRRLQVPLYAAVLEESRPPEAFLPGPCCLAIGHETGGVSEAVLRLATGRIRIPMPGRAESLNAATAAGILCYLAAQG